MRRASRRASGAALAALLMAVADPSHAAEAKGKGKDKGRFKLGPVYLTPKIVLRSAGVDTNVFNAESNEISDTSVALSPTIDALLPIGQRLRLSGNGGLDFNYFRRESSQRSTDVFGSGRAAIDLGPLTLFGGGGGGRYKQRFSIEVDQRLERHENRVDAGVTIRMGRKLSTTFEGHRQVSSYQGGVLVDGNDVKQALDRKTLGGSLQLRYSITQQTALTGSAELQEDRFLSEPRGPQDARSHRYSGGLEFGELAFINGGIRAGIREFPRRESQAVPPFRGLFLDVHASIPFFGAGRLGGVAIRDVTYAVTRARNQGQSQRNSYVSSRYGVNLSTELPLSLLARAELGFERASYLLPYTQDEAPLDRVDRVWTYGGGLLRAFGTSLRVGVTAAWSRRTSNLNDFGYRGLRYGLTAELTP